MAEPCANESVYSDLTTASLSMCAGDVGQRIGAPLARLAVPANLRLLASSFGGARRGGGFPSDRLAVALLQLGLVVEEVHLRRTAVHEQEDAALGLDRKMLRLGREQIGLAPARVPVEGAGQKSILLEHGRQRHAGKPGTRLPQELTARAPAELVPMAAWVRRFGISEFVLAGVAVSINIDELIQIQDQQAQRLQRALAAIRSRPVGHWRSSPARAAERRNRPSTGAGTSDFEIADRKAGVESPQSNLAGAERIGIDKIDLRLLGPVDINADSRPIQPHLHRVPADPFPTAMGRWPVASNCSRAGPGGACWF